VGYGALIVIERETGLQDYADRGTRLDGIVTRQLLINIFFPNSPLHDGAVIVRNDRILAAGCILPLSDKEAIDSSLGTRHRAAIGITDESDALAVVVSEETRGISLAHNGRLVPNLDQERLRRALRSLLKLDRDGRDGRGGQSTNGRGGPGRLSRERGDGRAAVPERATARETTVAHD
jgi:diadenylate cyclase